MFIYIHTHISYICIKLFHIFPYTLLYPGELPTLLPLVLPFPKAYWVGGGDTIDFSLVIWIFIVVNVTLDPETAHPKLIISDDQKSVRLGKKCQKLPNNPQRFDNSLIVLGSPSFVSGKRYWQVYVGDKTMWILGVCKNSVNRKGSTAFSPGNGYWLVMMKKKNDYSASTIPPTPLSLGEPPRCVGIFLDCEAGDISFYNVTAKSHIYTFSFSGSSSDPLRPVFSPGMLDKGKNADPLTICPGSS